MYNRGDNQYNNGRNQAGYGGGGYGSGYSTNAAMDNFQQINSLDYEIENIRKKRELIEQQQQMLEQQQRYQLQRSEPWDSGNQISVWDQPPSQFGGGRQDNYGGSRNASDGYFNRRNDRNRNSRGPNRGNNSRGSYNSSRGGNSSHSSFNSSGRGNNAGSRGEKRSAPALPFPDKRKRQEPGPILKRGTEPNSRQKIRIEAALGSIVKSIKARFPDKVKSMPWRILKDTLRKRLIAVLTGQPVGHVDEIVAHYRDLYPEDEDKALIVYVEQKKLEMGGTESAEEDAEEAIETPQKGSEPKGKERNAADILRKLVKQRLELMLARAYVEDLQETAEKYKPEEEDSAEQEEQNQEEDGGDNKHKDSKGRPQMKPRRKIPINIVKDAEENKYDEFMQGLDKEPHDHVDKVLLDYVRKDLPNMRDLMNAILLNGIVPWRLRQGMPWEKYNPDLLVRPKAYYTTWVCSPEPPSIESVKEYLSEGGYDVVAVKRPWRGLHMFIVLNKEDEYEKLLKIRNIKIEDCDIIVEKSEHIKTGNRGRELNASKQTSEGTDGQTQQKAGQTQQKAEQTQGNEQDDVMQEESVGEENQQSQEDDNENSQLLDEESEQIQDSEQPQDKSEENIQEDVEQSPAESVPAATKAAASIQNTRRSSRRMK